MRTTLKAFGRFAKLLRSQRSSTLSVARYLKRFTARVYLTAEINANLGVSTGDAEPGDCIVLLGGLRKPMLLRRAEPHNEYWRIVAPSVVGSDRGLGGIMLGDLWQSDESELEEFVIV